MTKLSRYKCPGCEGEFEYMHHPNPKDDPAPRFCPLCGMDSQAEDSDYQAPTPTAPSLRSNREKSANATYRAMEEGSNFRAEMARENGLDTDAANGLKITDMKTNLREGDTADVAVNNEVTKQMDAINARAPGTVGFQGAESGIAYSQTVATGPHPNAGARAMVNLRSEHRKFTAGAGHAGATSSDAPALETQSPAYKRRV